jgi:hypothetical protein
MWFIYTGEYYSAIKNESINGDRWVGEWGGRVGGTFGIALEM